MAKLDTKAIKEIREETGASILDIKNLLEEHAGDKSKVKELLKEKAKEKAAKKADREIKDGLVYSYIHGNGKVGSLILMGCETDFVAKTDDFVSLCKEIAMQATTTDYETVEDFLDDDYIRDPSKKVQDLISETIGKLGENITLEDFQRFSVK